LTERVDDSVFFSGGIRRIAVSSFSLVKAFFCWLIEKKFMEENDAIDEIGKKLFVSKLRAFI
jgi:hypothetical protein